MPWNTSGTFAVRLSVETLTANREILWPNFDGTVAVGAGIGSGVSTLTLHRIDTVNEGGELRFNRAAEDSLAWAIDVFGAGSVDTSLRFIDAKAGTVLMSINQSSRTVFVEKLDVSASATFRGTISISGTAVHSGFTQLGEASPVLKIKRLSATTAATEGGVILAAHGLTRTKILGIQALVETTVSNIPPSYTIDPSFHYNVYLATADVVVVNQTANSSSILSRPIRIILTYEA